MIKFGDNMTEQINIQNLTEIKDIIEENNAILRKAIQALKMLYLQKEVILQDVQQQPSPAARNYPGYTTPAKYGFMGNI